MIDWTIVCVVIGVLFSGTALFYKYVPPRKPNEDISKLRGEIFGLLRELEAQKQVASIWKERGDKYSAHNNSLHDDLKHAHKVIAEILKKEPKP